jgi:tRNA(Arg) A34 adenosine deaminase TadA
MCTGVAYWAGIRKIVFAVSKSKVSSDYYETPEDTQKLFASFNEKIEFKLDPELEEQALSVIKEWEKGLE